MRKLLGRSFMTLAIAVVILVILLNLLVSSQSAKIRQNLCEGELRTVNWSGRNLEGVDCAHQILREANFSKANLRHANLQGSDLSGATYLDDADLQNADLTHALLVGTSAVRANFSGAKLNHADLSNANLNGARLKGANLEGALLTNTSLIAADLSDLKAAPIHLNGANLTDARLGASINEMRLCNTTMPDGGVSKRDCFKPSYDLIRSAESQSWRSMDQDMSLMVIAAFEPKGPYVIPTNQAWDYQLTEKIRSMPCEDLRNLDRLWREASGDRFGFSIQRQIWESPEVNQDYTKFGEAVGWKTNGTWLKFQDLPVEGSSTTLPLGLFPWHLWQVQEPTPEEPTRFRRVGFGEWMNHLETCGL